MHYWKFLLEYKRDGRVRSSSPYNFYPEGETSQKQSRINALTNRPVHREGQMSASLTLYDATLPSHLPDFALGELNPLVIVFAVCAYITRQGDINHINDTTIYTL